MDFFQAAARTKRYGPKEKMDAHQTVSMDFPTLQHLSKHSTFNPILPTTYKSAEMLWSDLLAQACSYDKLCVNKRTVLNKATKRLRMLAKLVHTFEASICKPKEVALVSQSTETIPPAIHCQCCASNSDQVSALRAQLAENVQSTVDRDAQVARIESQLVELQRQKEEIEAKLTQSYTEVKAFKERTASTDVTVAKLKAEVAVRSQLMSGMQQVITKLVPALSFSVKPGSESPKMLPCAGPQGGESSL